MTRIIGVGLGIALGMLPGCGGAPRTLSNLSYDDRSTFARLDVYLPSTPEQARPAVLLIHGGGWNSNDRSLYSHPAIRLAWEGYVTANIDYRLAPASPYPAAIQDAECALSWFRAHAEEYGFDPARVAVMGYSAGGHLVSALGVGASVAAWRPDCAAGSTGPPAAVVSGAGVYDLRTVVQGQPVLDFLGGTLAQQPARYQEASPVTHVAAGDPPFLLVHGTADWYVNARQAVEMKQALASAGVEARLLTLEQGGHLLNPSSNLADSELEFATESPEAWIATLDFLKDTVGAP